MSTPEDTAKEQEKELRKHAIRQASSRGLGSRQDSNRSLNSVGSVNEQESRIEKAAIISKKAPPAVRRGSRSRPSLASIVRQMSNRSMNSSSGDESDPDEALKAQEKELRKHAIRQASNRSMNASDPDMLKEREKILRKHAIRQTSNRSMNTSMRSLNSSDPDFFGKEQEKALRKQAIRQASNRSFNSSSLGLVFEEEEKAAKEEASENTLDNEEKKPWPAKKAPPSSVVVEQIPEAAKRREMEVRRDMLQAQNSQRKLAPAKLTPVAPGSPKKAPPSVFGAKDRERQIRREILETQNSQRKLSASSPPVSPKKDPDMTAKDKEKLARHEMLSSGQPTAMVASVAAVPKADPGMAAKNREKLARQQVLESAPVAHEEVSRIDQGIEAKNRERQMRQYGTAIPANPDSVDGMSSLEEGCSKSQTERDAEAKRVARGECLGAVTPGATFCSIPLGSPPPGTLTEAEYRYQDKVTLDESAMQDEEMSADIELLPTPSVAEEASAAATHCTPLSRASDMTEENHVSFLQQDEKPEQNNNTTDTSSDGSPSGMHSGLIQATLVEDDNVVQATIATAQPADDLIRKQSAAETARVKKWRTIVCLALFATGVAVTVSTYFLLVDTEHKNFENVYYQFARTLGDAAVEQQVGLRKGLRMLSDTLSVTAETMKDENGTSPWPYFIMPRFEMLAADFKRVANAEFVGMQNYVEHDERDSYIRFITERYQDFVKESHMQAYGDLDNLDQNTSLYQPFIAQKLENGSFVEEEEHDYYFCRNHQSPPARAYAPTINNNLLGNKVISDGFHAVMELQSEPVFTTIKPFVNLPEDEHAKMHSNGAEGANNPHSFTFQPIHEVPQDYSSKIVAMFAVATAWDFSMLNLLPDNVEGMYCIVENTCNQTVTYRVDGGNATYIGEGELHNHDFDHMAVFVDLNLQEHPNASTTPGHCQYSMRIFPSKEFADDYMTSTPGIYASVVAGTFVMIGFMYLLYDLSVTRRNEKMISNAAKTNKILTRLVPDNIRDRIMGFQNDDDDNDGDSLNENELAEEIRRMDETRRDPELARMR